MATQIIPGTIPIPINIYSGVVYSVASNSQVMFGQQIYVKNGGQIYVQAGGMLVGVN